MLRAIFNRGKPRLVKRAGFVEVTALTNTGHVRERNEDSIGVGAWVASVSMQEPRCDKFVLRKPLLCVVADGIGGHADGHVASRHAVTRLSEEIRRIADASDITAILQSINAEFAKKAGQRSPGLRMGTTVVGLILLHSRLIWFNVGDSRMYRHDQGVLTQISVDDLTTMPGASQTGGKRSHIISQALGGTSTLVPIDPHVGQGDLPAPSRWLLCSDGLTDMLDLDAMQSCMEFDDRQAVLELLDHAMEAGGEDNISIIIVRVGDAF